MPMTAQECREVSGKGLAAERYREEEKKQTLNRITAREMCIQGDVMPQLVRGPFVNLTNFNRPANVTLVKVHFPPRTLNLIRHFFSIIIKIYANKMLY